MTDEVRQAIKVLRKYQRNAARRARRRSSTAETYSIALLSKCWLLQVRISNVEDSIKDIERLEANLKHKKKHDKDKTPKLAGRNMLGPAKLGR